MKRRQPNSVLHFTATLALSQLFILACASRGGFPDANQSIILKRSVAELHRKCRLKPKSGFSADLVISGQGTARIEAIWDNQRNIQGQILNPIGEDLLNFKIDSAGLQLVDQSIQAPDDVLMALDFLAQMGTGETRALLCSGLFLTETNIEQKDPPILDSETEREIELQGKAQWHLSSKLNFLKIGDENRRPEIRIRTEISKPFLFLKKHVATVDWQQSALSIQTKQLDLKLSFLDFE
ncbi:MAG: hypothetical protein RI932_1122 [Pseudomonadota bacterium]|jgi:hypothetical protein